MQIEELENLDVSIFVTLLCSQEPSIKRPDSTNNLDFYHHMHTTSPAVSCLVESKQQFAIVYTLFLIGEKHHV